MVPFPNLLSRRLSKRMNVLMIFSVTSEVVHSKIALAQQKDEERRKILGMQTNSADLSRDNAPELVQARCRFGQLIGSVYRQWRKKVDESFKGNGLTDATRMPLLVLYTQGEAMLQKDLAHALSLDTSSLVRVLAQLRDAEYVQWASSPEDRRTKCIVLTPQGEAIAAQILQKSLEIERAILAGLSPEELAVTRGALHKIAQSFEHIDVTDRAD